ncbi:MAG: TIGR03088 family PEP-CTERM/XrtA system glycosyltransferase [Methylovulum sp.]|uniref:TIGR03088 family PEP-CTERM/XrtA system glycosyltransferase n=1 Tax=Methylovulum sp. TaxID=1916980 RepID=UPI00261562C4|nr:TIGR03088 family PEP-CTERM/XrtA system glycosyltransferase [Methylovulum sp.]MDD2724995.1 TIGR03088 family PEP-CTERM/XrtA system glycosyltransferase [Methylovulum sp.]MDD5125594.1 TIGR03088 family PEP-CTERM/XrtA system glycosyltransferase [Methylovulum sp.]
MRQPPLVVHIIYRLGVGGLENGLVNLINNMPAEAYRHAIVCLKDSTDFRQRLVRNDVEVHELHKKDGQDWQSFIAMYRLLKQLRPGIVHTRNIGTMEYQISAFCAGVKHRVHGEHGWDVADPDGTNVKYQWLRRVLDLFVHRFIPLSRHLESYLLEKVHVPPRKITRIINGVDTQIFYPHPARKQPLDACPFTFAETDTVIGTIGRMHGVKDQTTLAKAFILACQRETELGDRLKLIIIGDGPLRAKALALLDAAGLSAQAWLPGVRDDVAEIDRRLDIFVLPSLAEGISNTILEAMACGLPVIATEVGGNPELVVDGVTGWLVPANDPEAMADKILAYVHNPETLRQHGSQGHQRVLQNFSLTAMVANYQAVYDSLCLQSEALQ